MESLHDLGIEHKTIEETLVAADRVLLRDRRELPSVIERLTGRIPAGCITGPPFARWPFLPVDGGYPVLVGIPVTGAAQTEGVGVETAPGLEVLSFLYQGPIAELGAGYRRLFNAADQRGLLSDESTREVYWDVADSGRWNVELHLVLHDWIGLMGRSLTRVAGSGAHAAVMRGSELLQIGSTLDQRFEWIRGAMDRLDGVAPAAAERFEVVSACAHVFPREPLIKLREAYRSALAATGDPLQGVDSVIAQMAADKTWFGKTERRGRVIYSTKNPCNPQRYAEAEAGVERRRAACYCALVRDHLDRGISPTFCYCSAGWERQAWQTAIGRAVAVDVVRSCVIGDDVCQFVIHLPDDL